MLELLMSDGGVLKYQVGMGWVQSSDTASAAAAAGRANFDGIALYSTFSFHPRSCESAGCLFLVGETRRLFGVSITSFGFVSSPAQPYSATSTCRTR